MIMATPYTDSKAIDYEDLAYEVEWLTEAGVQGMVWPQHSSENLWLKRDEIMRGMEVIAKAHKGKPNTLVLGVQQEDLMGMLEVAAHAEALAPDALIAIAPTTAKSQDDYREYYAGLAKLSSRPVFIQSIVDLPGAPFTVDLILELAGRFPHLGYVKEEHDPALSRIAELLKHHPDPIRRVFGGKFGRTLPYELRMGSDGTMTGGTMYPEVFVKIWDLYLQKDWDGLRDVYGKLLVMLTVAEEIPGAGRYLLQKRGIFKTAVSRKDNYSFSPLEIEVIEQNFKGLKPYLLRERVR